MFSIFFFNSTATTEIYPLSLHDALPILHSFSEEGEPLRLVEQSLPKDDPDPKAISCYGLYMPELKLSWLRFVDGRPVSAITTQFLEWCCQKLEELGKKVLVLIWDNASWHISREVRRWIGKRNREVKNSGSEAGVRIATCLLPKKSPWLDRKSTRLNSSHANISYAV